MQLEPSKHILQRTAAEHEMQRILDLQRSAFAHDINPNKKIRKDRLQRLLAMTQAHGDAIASVISADFGNRSLHQTKLGELLVVEGAIKHAIRHLAGWMRTRRAPTGLHYWPSYNRIMRQPLGVVGVISPWNYPFQLAICPAIGAVAAGNRVILKPSELTPRFSGLLKRIVAEYFSEDEIAVVIGDAEVGKVFAALPLDHLLFTGSTQVGRLVAQAAAKNLTPTTLELGGKSPVIIDPSADIEVIAGRVAHGKLFNAGQTCVAPDYVLLHESQQTQFVAAFTQAVAKMYPHIGANPDYTSIINDRHFSRLQSLIEDAREQGASIVECNPANESLDPQQRKMMPTLVLATTGQMRVLQEEIFGPILPILTYTKVEQVVEYINLRDRPLALYWMGRDVAGRNHVLKNTLSGGVTVNDCLWHFVQEDVPVGGVGASGSGAYHGEAGFRTFSKEKAIFTVSRFNSFGLLHPPYGKLFERVVKVLGKIL
ncbi:MAG: coniferyl aldehyde dehydrogenase [Pseudomonadota bacterium]